MPQIIPITDLRDTTMISEICHSKIEPIYITKNGYSDMVIMSIETYEAMFEGHSVDSAIVVAEAEYEQTHELLDAQKKMAALRRKHLG